jgi:hypothetical protein
VKIKARPTREHQVLIRLFQKALSESGRSYGQLAITTGISRSGVHHFVNGTDRRFPSTEKYVLLVRALGGDPAAAEWLNPYKAAAASYGKDVRRAAIPVIAHIRHVHASGDASVAVSAGGIVIGEVLDSQKRRTVAPDANRPQRAQHRLSAPPSPSTGVIVLVMVLLVLQALLMGFWLGGDTEVLEPPPPPRYDDARTTVAVVTDQNWSKDPRFIPFYDSPAAESQIHGALPDERFDNACRVMGTHHGREWVKVKGDWLHGYAYVPVRFIVNADKLVACAPPPRDELLGFH